MSYSAPADSVQSLTPFIGIARDEAEVSGHSCIYRAEPSLEGEGRANIVLCEIRLAISVLIVKLGRNERRFYATSFLDMKLKS